MINNPRRRCGTQYNPLSHSGKSLRKTVEATAKSVLPVSNSRKAIELSSIHPRDISSSIVLKPVFLTIEDRLHGPIMTTVESIIDSLVHA